MFLLTFASPARAHSFAKGGLTLHRRRAAWISPANGALKDHLDPTRLIPPHLRPPLTVLAPFSGRFLLSRLPDLCDPVPLCLRRRHTEAGVYDCQAVPGLCHRRGDIEVLVCGAAHYSTRIQI